MNTQSFNAPDKKNHLTLELLQAIEQKDNISQRHLAQHMGVALGLANASLKRCVKKGWIKITSAPANRYLYYLTPSGFAEKARLTNEFLRTSLSLFRQAGEVYRMLFDDCISQGKHKVLFAGLSDLTEIAYLKSLESDVSVVGVYQPNVVTQSFFDLPVISSISCDSISAFDCVIMTSLEQTSDIADDLSESLGSTVLLTPAFLVNMQYRNELLKSPVD